MSHLGKRPFLILLGPTASGKTQRLLELAETLPLTVISADSAQVYRYLDIGTNKPSPSVLQHLPHELVDLIELDSFFTAHAFSEHARASIPQLHQEQRLPILCGGTGFYIRYFLVNRPPLPPIEACVQRFIHSLFAEQGAKKLHQQLQHFDPISFKRLHPQDVYRLQRAYAVLCQTGLPYSSFLSNPTAHPFLKNHPFLCVLLEKPRDILRQSITERTKAMFRAGWKEEFLALLAKGISPSCLAFQRVLGYRELAQAYLQGLFSQRYEAELQEKIAQKTQQYAKRQKTFFRQLPYTHTLAYNDTKGLHRLMRTCFDL